MLKIKTLKPLITNVLTTGDKYEEDMWENGIIVANKGDLKLYQKVLAIGSAVRDIKVGDQIMFSLQNYAVMKYDPNSLKNDMDMNKVVKWNLPYVTLYDEEDKPYDCLLLTDRDIQFVFEGEEVQGSKNPILIPDNKKVIIN